MWSLLKTATFALCAQHSASQVMIQFRKEKAPNDFSERGRFDSVLQAQYAKNPEHSLVAMSDGQNPLTAADPGGRMVERQLEYSVDVVVLCTLRVIFVVQLSSPIRRLQDGTAIETTIAVEVTITNPTYGPIVYSVVGSVGSDNLVTADVPLTLSYLINDNDTGLCEACTVSVVAGECLSGSCADYDMDGTNAMMNIISAICGDPHMVGLLGQKIDWYGEDNGWYCLLADSKFQINTRVTAPMPEEFPTRQLVSGVSLITADGHTLVIEVKDPYTTTTDGCSTSLPCLADGALRILVDGKEFHDLQTPGEGIALPGGVVVSSTNLPVECRPFGGDRIWAAQYAAMDIATGGRSLRAGTPLVDWLLEADTIAAPEWCAKFVGENGSAGMSKVQSNHAIVRIETPAVTLRVNIGVNYQESVLGADGILLVPELEFWQTDLAFEGLLLSGKVGGMLGDTSSFALDHDGMPMTSGMAALHGPVESYRVPGSLGVNFEQQLL